MENYSIQCVVIYPFASIKGSIHIFRTILSIIKEFCTPIVVYDERCPNPDIANEHLDIAKKEYNAQIVYSRGADTCQNWLDGWRVAIKTKAKRVILLPGDLQNLKNEDNIFNNIRNFVKADSHKFIIGNFKSIDPYSAKELIDVYGVFPLIANWFPEAWCYIRYKNIEKPRSEFLNLSMEYLQEMLMNRPFAYEQTLSMLIRAWYQCKNTTVHGKLICTTKGNQKWTGNGN